MHPLLLFRRPFEENINQSTQPYRSRPVSRLALVDTLFRHSYNILFLSL